MILTSFGLEFGSHVLSSVIRESVVPRCSNVYRSRVRVDTVGGPHTVLSVLQTQAWIAQPVYCTAVACAAIGRGIETIGNVVFLCIGHYGYQSPCFGI